jgi:hypothetical protein
VPAGPASPSSSVPSEQPANTSHDAAPSQHPDDTSGKTRGSLQLVVVASVPEIATGGIMTVDVMASASSAVVDAPLHLAYDPHVVEFVEGTPGDFLTQGGSSVVFLVDGQSRPGDVAIAAGRVERMEGARGAGLLCRVRFRGIGAGTTSVLVGQAKAWGNHGEELTVVTGGTTVSVR